jgi:hypothetical protein
MASILRLSALALLCGCGGERGETSDPRSGLNLTGNWQVSTASTVLRTPPVTISGSITQSGSSVNGEVHLNDSNCFDRLTTIGLTGTLTGRNVSLTSASVGGQVITFRASIANNALTGAYAVNGGCANGDQGNVAGFKVPAFSGTWRSGFEINEEHFFGLANLTGSASSEGSFGIVGTVDDSSNFPCLSGDDLGWNVSFSQLHHGHVRGP